MVQPIFTAPGLLEEGLERAESLADGLIQRGRLRAYNPLTRGRGSDGLSSARPDCDTGRRTDARRRRGRSVVCRV